MLRLEGEKRTQIVPGWCVFDYLRHGKPVPKEVREKCANFQGQLMISSWRQISLN